ncbi:MAG: hypothetical protein K2H30_06310 [Clostridia bacterium]|nr:hypothetical protein [Clostridia bacterium]
MVKGYETMRTDKINYSCDDCNAHAVFRSDEKARKAGWAVARDSVTCWCPNCAPAHRLGGANGKSTAPHKRKPPQGYEQLKIEV